MSFNKKDRENLYPGWEAFKSMLRDCPYHHQTNDMLMHTFIEGLELTTKILMDSTVGGQALEKDYDKLYML